MIYEQFGDLSSNTAIEIWCRGYYVDTVGKNKAKIQDYIKHQLESDKLQRSVEYLPYQRAVYGPQITRNANVRSQERLLGRSW